jgi:hypothetical protein
VRAAEKRECEQPIPTRREFAGCPARRRATRSSSLLTWRARRRFLRRARGRLDAYAILAAGADAAGTTDVPVIEDRDGQFAAAYGATGACAYLIRPAAT